jgi:hypothetical protein
VTLPAAAADAPSWPPTLPRYDHVIIVVEENKDYDQIIGSVAAPYLNKLASEGASLARMFGEEHPSEGNYFWLFSGGNQGVGFFDQVPRAKLTASSLGEQLIKKGLTFKGYSGRSVARSPSPRQAAATHAFMAASTFHGSALPMFRTGRRSRPRRTCVSPIFRRIIPGCRPPAGLTHVNILRTIEAMYGLPKSGCATAQCTPRRHQR